jgi:histone H3/H4
MTISAFPRVSTSPGLPLRSCYPTGLQEGTEPFPHSQSLILVTATVQKIVGEILPAASGIAFSREARDLLIDCCVEFITLVSSEANEISEKEAKKTIACDHITKALEQLGFAEYVPAVLEAAAEHKEVQKVRS